MPRKYNQSQNTDFIMKRNADRIFFCTFVE